MFGHRTVKHFSITQTSTTTMCMDFTSIAILWKIFWLDAEHFDFATYDI